MVISRGTYESLPSTTKRMAMTSSQAHCLPFSGGGGQTQLFNVECQGGRTIALLSDFAVIATVIFSQRAIVVQ